MAPPRKSTLPKPLPDGFILTDTEKKKWRLGKVIGQGGFGLIYLASQDVDTPVSADTDFVIKVEYHDNGPLFSELKFYQRAAKPESMQKWIRRRKLDFLGIPAYWGSGLAEHNGTRYRFMAMDRLGTDLQKVCERNGGRLKKATVLRLGQELLDMLEYIHENEYVHADIKAANLMLGYRNPDKVYLVDYGLSYRYCPEGVHKEYKENPKKGHNGTIEYTSLDAHHGVAPSRRGDLQVLGFCLLHWLCGALPWDCSLKNPTQVQESKARLMEDLPSSVQELSMNGASTDELARFLLYVNSLTYKECPDYQRLKELLGSCSQGKLDFSAPQAEHLITSHTRTVESPARGKKAGKPGGSAHHVDEEEEEDPTTTKPVPVHNMKDGPIPKPDLKTSRTRRPSKPQSVAMEVDEGKEQVEIKVKVPPCNIKGPPITRPQPQQEAGKVPARRQPRPKPEPTDAEDNDDKETRSKPIDPRYIRGPPISSRPQPKQVKTQCKRPIRKTMDPDTMPSRTGVQQRIRQFRPQHIMGKCDVRIQGQQHYVGNIYNDGFSQSHLIQWEELRYMEEEIPKNAACYPNIQCCDNGCSGKLYYDQWDTDRYRAGMGEMGSENNSVPQQRNDWHVHLYCTAFVGLFLFLVALVALT